MNKITIYHSDGQCVGIRLQLAPKKNWYQRIKGKLWTMMHCNKDCTTGKTGVILQDDA